MTHSPLMEGKPSWWMGRASNPVGGAMRCWVGSTPIPLRQMHSLGCHSAFAKAIEPLRRVIAMCAFLDRCNGPSQRDPLACLEPCASINRTVPP